MSVRPISLTREVRCHVSRREVWAHVSDTLRLNRSINSSTLEVKQKDTSGLERFELRARLGGLVVSYIEHPFSWSVGEYFSFYRGFMDGPAQSVSTRYDFADAPDGAGCDVTLRVEITPRAEILRPIVWFATKRAMASTAEYIASAGQRRPVVSPIDPTVLTIAKGRLAAKQPELVERLAKHLSTADDFDLAPIRPFALAKEWEVDRLQLLRLCLEGVPAGLLELRWGLLCPSCNGTATVLPSLRELEGRSHCHACDIRFDSDLDRSVEAQFFPHPSLRTVDVKPYCIGGPALTPHVLTQIALEADAEKTIRVPSEQQRLRLFARGGAIASVDVRDGAPDEVRCTIEANEIRPPHLALAPGGSIHIENRSGDSRHAKLERMVVTSDAATAHHVATMPEFRPLFGAEALRPGLALRVAHVAILFSDLCGSTALYSNVGDAEAFGLVTDCLTFGKDIVERHGGTVVKTIGDAIMAAFADSRDAVAAGVEMVTEWSAFAGKHPGADAVDLKVGVYDGPCTIVTANEAVDYFGQTVNRAARVQHLAGPRECVIGASLAGNVPEGRVEVLETFEARVKGIDEPLSLLRLRPRGET